MKRHPSHLSLVPDMAEGFKPPRRSRRAAEPKMVPTFTDMVGLLSQAADVQRLAERMERAAGEKDYIVVRALAPRLAIDAKDLAICIGRLVRKYDGPLPDTPAGGTS